MREELKRCKNVSLLPIPNMSTADHVRERYEDRGVRARNQKSVVQTEQPDQKDQGAGGRAGEEEKRVADEEDEHQVQRGWKIHHFKRLLALEGRIVES